MPCSCYNYVSFFGIDQEKSSNNNSDDQLESVGFEKAAKCWAMTVMEIAKKQKKLKWIVRQLGARCVWVGLLQSAYFNTCISQCCERTLAPSSTMNTKDQQTNISDKTWESLSRYHVIRFCRQHCYYYIAISRNICCIHFSAFSQFAAHATAAIAAADAAVAASSRITELHRTKQIHVMNLYANSGFTLITRRRILCNWHVSQNCADKLKT